MIRQLMRLLLTGLVTVPAYAQEPLSDATMRKDFLTWKFGMFIHFNIATFNQREWATGHEDPSTFSPEKLDCSQWIDAAASAVMKYAVLTVKHTGGWCLWDSKHTGSHDMTAFVNYKGGKGDIVREFVDACRKRGVKVGLYYCFPGDFSKRAGLPQGKEDLHGLPPEAKGNFTEFIKKQLTELLTEYGKIDQLWIDQYRNPYTPPADWLEIRKHIKRLQPGCLVIANNSHDFEETDIHSYEYPWMLERNPSKALPAEGNTDPAEVCDKMGPGWFWTPEESGEDLMTAEKAVKMLKLCNSRQANYLLNVAPDASGLVPPYALERLRGIGELLASSNGHNRQPADDQSHHPAANQPDASFRPLE